MIDTCYIGDVRDGLRAMIAAGVRAQTCVTSPPYWGLRDYGTGQWSGGDPAHEHDRVAARNGRGGSGSPGKNPEGAFPSEYPADVCSCGARRVDHQLGLEATPAEYLRNMVDVFRLVRDVLADDGCIWVNMGDSYAGSRCGGETDASTLGGSRESQEQSKHARASFRRDRKVTPRSDVKVSGIKPKDLVGMPWRLALALQEDGWWLRSDIIWAKPNPMPESCTDRPTKSHEYLFLLAKSEIYYYDADAIKEPASEDTHARYARGRSDTHKYADGGPGDQTIAKSFEHMRDDRQIHKPVAGWATGDYFHDAVSHAKAKDERHGKLLKHPGNGVGFGHGYDENVKPRVAGVTPKSAAPDSGIRANESFHAVVGAIVSTRNKRTVWTIPTEPFPGAHFATFPTALVEPCILAGSRVGDIVLDPFMGSGTVAQVALELGRRWVGCELNAEYAAMQGGRTRQTGLAFG